VSLSPEAKEEAAKSIEKLQGVLIYKGNRLIRRLETIIGEDDDQIAYSMTKQPSQFLFK
jgi:hypothetical protein